MKPLQYIKNELNLYKGVRGTLRKHHTELGLHCTDFKSKKEYYRALAAQHKYLAGHQTRTLLKEQVNGTIFAHGHDDGFVTYQEGEIL